MTWDNVASGSGGAARAGAEGLLEELDYNIIDVSTFYPTLKSKFCVGGDVFSTVAAWNTATYGEKGSQNWADFWDVKKFPGARAYRGKVDGALEPALLADGVPIEKVYEVLATEEGMKRAIDKIRELKPHIAVWWKSGAPQARLMKDGEVDMTTGWNGRFDVAKKDGAKVSYTFNQANQLSGGQKQRVALARAIVFGPRILLMDEPLSALDKKLREHMQIELRHLHEKLGMTTVYVTHDQREALTMSDRIAVINHGRLMQLDEPRQIYERPASKLVADFIGESTFLPVERTGKKVSLAGKTLKVSHLPEGDGELLLLVRPERLTLVGKGASSS
jgi:hypothetical protein